MVQSESRQSSTQEAETPDIDRHWEYINLVMRWSTTDLDVFVDSLRVRLSAEKAYLGALNKIPKLNAQRKTPESETTSNSSTSFRFKLFLEAASQYDNSLEKTIESKEEFITCLKNQIELLLKVKDSHEQRRKKVKAVLGEKNINYTVFRDRDLAKSRKSYFIKCKEYSNLQQNNKSGSFYEDQLDTDTHSQDNPGSKRSRMSGFITQMRSQLSVGEASKQTTKLTKLKKETVDADQDYRQSIRILEFLRKKQAETSVHAMKHLEAILIGKSDAVKAIMSTILKQEQDTLSNEINLVQQTLNSFNSLDSRKDTDTFFIEYEKFGFVKPKPIFYENYYYGPCKEILFGSNLNEYYQEHNRTVPLLVTKCIKQVELLGGLEKEDIYEISGPQATVDQLKHELEKDEEAVDLEAKKYDLFTIASVLKDYLRELNQPLFNLSVTERMEYAIITDEAIRKSFISQKLAELPIPHRHTLKAVIIHLAKVENYSQMNKMTVKKLSSIFGPILTQIQAEDAVELDTEKLFEELVFRHESLFADAEKQVKTLEPEDIDNELSLKREPMQLLDTTTTLATFPIPNNYPVKYKEK